MHQIELPANREQFHRRGQLEQRGLHLAYGGRNTDWIVYHSAEYWLIEKKLGSLYLVAPVYVTC